LDLFEVKADSRLRRQQTFMETAELAKVLVALGCPAEKSADMAAQLDKRARQLAETKGRSYDEALQHLLKLMSQGWAAPPQIFDLRLMIYD